MYFNFASNDFVIRCKTNKSYEATLVTKNYLAILHCKNGKK